MGSIPFGFGNVAEGLSGHKKYIEVINQKTSFANSRVLIDPWSFGNCTGQQMAQKVNLDIESVII